MGGRWPRARTVGSIGRRVWTEASSAPWARICLRRFAWMRTASPVGRHSAPSLTGLARPTGPPKRKKQEVEAHMRQRELAGVPPVDEAQGLLGLLGGHNQGVRQLS